MGRREPQWTWGGGRPVRSVAQQRPGRCVRPWETLLNIPGLTDTSSVLLAVLEQKEP